MPLDAAAAFGVAFDGAALDEYMFLDFVKFVDVCLDFLDLGVSFDDVHGRWVYVECWMNW